MAGGVRGRDAAWGHPHWAHPARGPTWLQGELLHLWGLVSLGGFLLNLASCLSSPPTLDPSLGSQAYLPLSFPPNTLGLPTVAGRGLLGHGDAHSHCPQAEWGGDIILERQEGHWGDLSQGLSQCRSSGQGLQSPCSQGPSHAARQGGREGGAGWCPGAEGRRCWRRRGRNLSWEEPRPLLCLLQARSPRARLGLLWASVSPH